MPKSGKPTGKPSIRDAVKEFSPKWFQTGVAEKFFYSCALTLDALNEKLREAMMLHIPTYGSPSALPFLGADRVLTKGPSESDTSFAIRLKYAYDDWQHAGSDWAVMRQGLAILTPFAPRAEIVSQNSGVVAGSTWSVYPAGASTLLQPARVVPVAAWNWDTGATDTPYNFGYWRFWLVLFATAPQAFAAPAPFKFGTAGVKIGLRPDASIGLNIPSSTVKSVQAVLALWKTANSWCRWMIISFDDTLFDPTQPADNVHNPNGTFGNWGKIVSGVMVPARFANARYCDGAL